MVIDRRDFLKTTGLVIGCGSWISQCARAGADVTDDYERLVPADKGFTSQWLESLTARGEPTVYTDPRALEQIGMPIGGLFAGTVYLGGDGIIEGAQPNTLDAAWYGKISFLVSLYLAALRAGEAMADEMGDAEFAARCKKIADRGAQSILALYNGEYFHQQLDPEHADVIGCGTGCYIDQVFGQFWAHQVGLGRLFDAEKQRSALRALFRYNFVPHVGRFRETFTRGRWYASDDDQGLIMCSWPRGGLNRAWHRSWQFMYFNECMSGFEWQAAAHMISEGLLTEGLALSRAIHDRYDGRKRNPYNEIECSDHYARAMASYGAFVAACGFEHHGPKGYIGFFPKLEAGNFKAAFTAAGGWGSVRMKKRGRGTKLALTVK